MRHLYDCNNQMSVQLLSHRLGYIADEVKFLPYSKGFCVTKEQDLRTASDLFTAIQISEIVARNSEVNRDIVLFGSSKVLSECETLKRRFNRQGSCVVKTYSPSDKETSRDIINKYCPELNRYSLPNLPSMVETKYLIDSEEKLEAYIFSVGGFNMNEYVSGEMIDGCLNYFNFQVLKDLPDINLLSELEVVE